MTDDRGRGRRRQGNFKRTQDFLMPGLRHAHTLQQLKSLIEYSPPGEYLNKPTTDKPLLKQITHKEINIRPSELINPKEGLINSF